jgi:hypothetical protein
MVVSNAQNKTEVMRLKLPENSVIIDHLQLKSLSHRGFDDKSITIILKKSD